ncbi:heavy metal-binding domain-containing protein [uncultured Phascolarctobacterium sp.]|uniref:heavy metal-binding domain-containing protein n=1 Tax=uncultured Phascolarctobacterium sp. TaxID=512296 RepID=UPI0025FD9045|nr:heavy metal-binding domain-containing protein [uncultured Phascolarctobacterium sp.]
MPFWDTDYKKEAMKSKERREAAEQREAEAKQRAVAYRQKVNAVIVTTGDLKEDYEIIGPVYFQVSNKGMFSSTLSELVNKYSAEIEEMKNNALMSERRTDWGFLWGEYSVGQNEFEKAFFVAIQELKKRALMLGGDAVVSMRQDIDLDTNGFQYFYLQMYGTAVKRING